MAIKSLDESEIIALIAKYYGVDEDDVDIHIMKIKTPHGLMEYVMATLPNKCSDNNIRKI